MVEAFKEDKRSIKERFPNLFDEIKTDDYVFVICLKS